MCISHPDQRDWIRLRGTICREPFRIGVHPVYDHNMLLFDHDAQVFPGSSGAPIIDMTGQVMGMQLTEACVEEHVICVRDQNRLQNIAEYENADDIVCQVKGLLFRPCNLKQAVTVQYISGSLGPLFPEEDVGPGQDLNGYLRNLVTSFLLRQARRGPPRGQGSKQLQVPPPGKKPRGKTLLQSKMGCEERATMDFPTRIRSALGAGAAKGLASLHEDCNPKILNRHVKATNILLNAKAFDPNSTSLCIHESAGALVSSSDAKKILINECLSGPAVLDVSSKAIIKLVLKLSPSHQNGSGFVRFGDENEDSRAMNEMNGQYCSRPMSSGVATPKKPSTPQQQYSLHVGAAANGAFTQGSQSDDDTCNTTVYVGGLDFDVGDEEVRHAFSQFGEVSVKIPIGKGCGFVQLVERSSAENSINQLNGTVVGKQTVHLSWGQNPGNKQAFSDELYVRNESQCVSGLPKSEMDIFGPVKAIGDELRLFHLELEADKEKTAAELHNQLDAIVYKAMATC